MSSRWSKSQNLGDCKTCLCRISPQKNRPENESDEESSASSGGEFYAKNITIDHLKKCSVTCMT
jgi:hypothetical protein